MPYISAFYQDCKTRLATSYLSEQPESIPFIVSKALSALNLSITVDPAYINFFSNYRKIENYGQKKEIPYQSTLFGRVIFVQIPSLVILRNDQVSHGLVCVLLGYVPVNTFAFEIVKELVHEGFSFFFDGLRFLRSYLWIAYGAEEFDVLLLV